MPMIFPPWSILKWCLVEGKGSWWKLLINNHCPCS